MTEKEHISRINKAYLEKSVTDKYTTQKKNGQRHIQMTNKSMKKVWYRTSHWEN